MIIIIQRFGKTKATSSPTESPEEGLYTLAKNQSTLK
jgi:hypothetical protein